MILFGGFNNGYRTNLVFRLNLKTLKWDKMEAKGSKPCARTGHSAVVFNDQMIIFGGKSD
jgi:N-acetylneuraminic acid mutarotase